MSDFSQSWKAPPALQPFIEDLSLLPNILLVQEQLHYTSDIYQQVTWYRVQEDRQVAHLEANQEVAEFLHYFNSTSYSP